MGIKKFFSFCKTQIKDSCHEISLIPYIEDFVEINNRSPKLMINLSTFSYNHHNHKSLLCGYQLNRLKEDFEKFLRNLEKAGAIVEFVVKKPKIDDEAFMERRLEDYRTACTIIDQIKKEPNLERLVETFHDLESSPYNVAILATLVQSAKKFGPVHCQNESSSRNSAIVQIQIAKSRKIDFLMGLDTYYFVFGSGLKIWSDINFNMDIGTLLEFDPKIIMKYLNLTVENAPLFAAVATASGLGKHEIMREDGLKKALQKHFGFGSRDFFRKLAKFAQQNAPSREPDMTRIDEDVKNAIQKIYKDSNPTETEKTATELEDFLNLLSSFDNPEEHLQDESYSERTKLMKNDFSNFGDAILKGNPIFLNPVFLDLRCNDLKPLIELVKPLLMKTSVALAQEFNVQRDIDVISLDDHNGKFTNFVFKPETSSESFDFWADVVEIPSYLQNDIAQDIPSQYCLDVYVLMYLLKTKSVRLTEARIIMATLAEVRKRRDLVNPDYPKTINERALRLTFLFSKMYFYFISCLSAIGMNEVCAEFRFDGVFFQKLYQLNILEESQEKDVSYGNLNKLEIIHDFASIIRHGLQ